MRRRVVALFMVLAASACSSKPANTNNTLTVTFTLPAWMKASTINQIGRVEVYFDETGTAGLFAAESALSNGTTENGIPYEKQVADIDGDGKLEFFCGSSKTRLASRAVGR